MEGRIKADGLLFEVQLLDIRDLDGSPLLDDFRDHDLFGPVMREGIATGRVEGERAFFLKLLAKRFGPVPEWVSKRLEQLGEDELENLGLRFLEVKSLEELFGAH